MAIERAEELSETEEVSEMELEGEELPLTLLGGQSVSPGDIVRIKVVAVPDDESGMWRGVYASDKPKTSSIDEMASVYKSPKDMEV